MRARASNVVEDASLTLGKVLFSSCPDSHPPFFYDNMIFKIGLTSTSDFKKYYTITIDNELQTVRCDCKAGRIIGRCKHIRFYKGLIASLLHENPGFTKEKGD